MHTTDTNTLGQYEAKAPVEPRQADPLVGVNMLQKFPAELFATGLAADLPKRRGGFIGV